MVEYTENHDEPTLFVAQPTSFMHNFITCLLLLTAVSARAQNAPHAFPLHYTLHTLHADIIPLAAGEKAAMADAIIQGEVVATQSFWKNNRIA
ncbi:MAG: hypothetical protein ACPH8E_05780, partial [Flavobacteriales bacterium]